MKILDENCKSPSGNENDVTIRFTRNELNNLKTCVLLTLQAHPEKIDLEPVVGLNREFSKLCSKSIDGKVTNYTKYVKNNY